MSQKYTQHNVPGPEFVVRPVVRYIVTRYCHPYTHVSDQEDIPVPGGSELIAEVASEARASELCAALSAAESGLRAAQVLRAPGTAN